MTTRSSLLASFVFVLGGCTSTISGAPDPHGSEGGASGNGTGGTTGSVTGGTGSAATGGSGGVATGGSGQATGGQAGVGVGQGGSSTGGTAGGAPLPSLVLDAGRAVLRRLNRTEYNNTVRDLLGTSLRPGDELPKDEEVDGFDTVGEGLGMTMSRMETLERGASALLDELFALPANDARRASVLVCDPASGEACTRQILAGFARRAFRRPIAEAEILSLLALVQKVVTAGNSQQEALKAGLSAVLLSPNFLYMVERGTPPGSTAASPLNDHELATRLSYFLWSSMPDDELSAAADAGTLTRDAAALGLSTNRMISSGKAAAFTENFVGQWLTLRRLPLVESDPQTFPNFTVALRDASVLETQRFVRSLIDDNAPLETLLTGEFTFANRALATHYGVSAMGQDFERVSLASTPRSGLLGQLSFLLQTSHPSQTSPTKRGAWVLEQVLCAPPDPPPPELMNPVLSEPEPGQSVRKHLEQHREDPSCAGCHAELDPIGFGLENFDAVGAYRTMDNGAPVDSTGTLYETPFSGARELAALLVADPKFVSCTAQQLLTYAVGRPFSVPEAQSYAAALIAHARAGGRNGFRDLIDTVISSEAFRTRRGD